MKIAKRLLITLAAGVVALGASALRAADAPDPAPAPPTADAPAATKPTAKVSDEARKLIDQIGDAYGKLKTLQLAGTVSSEAKVADSNPDNHSTTFTSSYSSPNRFRSEVKDDILVGSTGQKLYMFKADQNAYIISDAPKEKVATRELPGRIARLLEVQNPSLVLAMSKAPGNELTDGVTEATTGEDTKLGNANFKTLKLVQDDKSSLTLAVDPQSYLVRQAKLDLTQPLKARRPDLSSAIITIDYTMTTPDAVMKDEFAWTPPAGATDAAAMADAEGHESAPASELEGKEAPKFKLDSVSGKPVALADLKGHVVIIDFWATWCGPCRASLPHLDKLYNEFKDKGLSVYALDKREEKGDVEAFIKETKLSVPVLLDSEGKVGEQYSVEGIPQTVVIGKDGKVKKVFIGFNPDQSPEQLKHAVKSAMKE